MSAHFVRLPVEIRGTGSVLPGRKVHTREVAATAYPDRDPAVLIQKTGIETRYWAPPELTHAALGAQALRIALEDAQMEASALRRIIQVDSTGGDMMLPATANAIGEALGLTDTCDCIDLDNACMGFLSAFDLAARCVATGLGPVAVVVSEIWSKHLHPEEKRTYAVFGDAGVAVIFDRPRDAETGVAASWLRNDGRLRGSVTLAHAGITGEPEHVRFGASNRQIGAEATEALVRSAHEALAQARLEIGEIDWVLPHQPNGRMLETIADRLHVSTDRMLRVVDDVGSVGAASIPLSLDRLRRAGKLGASQRVLMSGVGSGIGYGSMIYTTGPAMPTVEGAPT